MNPRYGRSMLLVWLMSGACDDGRAENREAKCQEYCDKLELCDDRTDLNGCERRCVEESTRSDDYMAARTQCASERSCNVWIGEVGVMGEDTCTDDSCQLNDCTADELARRELTKSERTYCEGLVSKLNACDHSMTTAVLEARCHELVPALSQRYLDQIQGCIEVDCSQVKACLEAVRDRFNTEISVYPETPSRPEQTGPMARRTDSGTVRMMSSDDAGMSTAVQ